MKIEDIKIGDTIECRRELGSVYHFSWDPFIDFHGKVEKIENGVIYMDNPASVRIDKVVAIRGK